MDLEQTALQSIMNEQEYSDFRGVFAEVCKNDPNIVGVLTIGSLVQNLRLPDVPTSEISLTEREKAYETIRNRSRRRIFPSANSDLDIWVCTTNPEDAIRIQAQIETRAMELIDLLVGRPEIHGTRAWVDSKLEAFQEFYKQCYLYSSELTKRNMGRPWDVDGFKSDLIRSLTYWLPDVVRRVNYHFTKKIPGDFMEVRAYPQCTFNLRPEDLIIDGKVEKSPFPRIMNPDWIDTNRNTMVLYVSERVSHQLIYPFDESGMRLGERISQFIKES